MKNIKLYIDDELADFDGEINIKAKVYDILDDEFGYYHRSYTIELPLTHRNKRLVKFINQVNTRYDTAIQGRIEVDDIKVINGDLRFMSAGDDKAKFMIEASEWYNSIRELYIDELWTSGGDHTFNGTNVAASWSAAAGSLYRYPLLHLGDTPRAGKVDVVYFMPMWSIYQIFLKIMASANLNYDTNNWFVSTAAKSMYVLFPCKNIKSESYLERKDTEAMVNSTSDNYSSKTHTVLTYEEIDLYKTVDFDNIIINEGSNWDISNNRYDIPATGTYRFAAEIGANCTHTGSWFENIAQAAVIRIKYYNGSTTATLIEKTYYNAGGDDSIFDGTIFGSADTGYFHAVSGGYVYVEVALSSYAYNPYFTLEIDLYLNTNSKVWTELDEWCLYPSVGINMNPGDYLPHITAVKFLQAIKKIFGLIFWFDEFNNKLYCKTFNDFVGSTVIDMTNKQDYGIETEVEELSYNYPYMVEFKYLPDTEDWIYSNATHFDEVPLRHRIYLESLYLNEEGHIVQNEILSPAGKYTPGWLTNRTIQLSAIFGSEEIDKTSGFASINHPPKLFNGRLFEWFGDVSPTSPETISWNFYDSWNDSSPTTKTTYPKVETPDMEDNYALFSKRYYIIDNKKKTEVTVRMTPMEFLKFVTVFNDAANEGFRALYKLNVNGDEGLFIVQSVTFDGYRSKLELIQR